MVESIIYALLYLCGLAIAFFLIVWVLEQLGVVIPAQIMKTLYVVVVLIAILILWYALSPGMGGGRLHAMLPRWIT